MITLLFSSGNVIAQSDKSVDSDSHSFTGQVRSVDYDEWMHKIEDGSIQLLASASDETDIFLNSNEERAVSQIQIHVDVYYDKITNAILFYSTLYSPNPFDSPGFTSATGVVTVSGNGLFLSDSLAQYQQPGATIAFNNRIQDGRFQSG